MAPVATAPVALAAPDAAPAAVAPTPSEEPSAAAAGTTSRSSAGSATAESSSTPQPAIFCWVASAPEDVIIAAPAYRTRPVAGLKTSQATIQAMCLRHQELPHSVIEAAAASGRVPERMTITPSR